jgi:spermidine synthase
MNLLGKKLKKNGDGKPFVCREGRELGLHFSDDIVQSYVNLDDPNKLELGYTRTLMGFLLFVPSPKAITMIGLGGGAVPKYCYNKLPDARITVAEICPDVIALRDEFAIPPDNKHFQVHCADGADFVKKFRATQDVIVVDGYDIGGQAPSLCTEAFYGDCYRALADNGVMVVNLFSNETQHNEIIRNIKSVFRDFVVTVKSEDIYNKIVFAIKGNPADFPVKNLFMAADHLESSHDIDFNNIVLGMIANQKNDIAIA